MKNTECPTCHGAGGDIVSFDPPMSQACPDCKGYGTLATMAMSTGKDERGEFFQYQLKLKAIGYTSAMTRKYYEEIDIQLIQNMPEMEFNKLVAIVETEQQRRLK